MTKRRKKRWKGLLALTVLFLIWPVAGFVAVGTMVVLKVIGW